MNLESPYQTIEELIREISENAGELESGNLSAEQLDSFCGKARELYERLVVIRFKAFENEVKSGKSEVIPEIQKPETEIHAVEEPAPQNEVVPEGGAFKAAASGRWRTSD